MPEDCLLCGMVANPDHPGRIAEFPTGVAVLNWMQAYPGRSIFIFKQHHENLLTLPAAVLHAFTDDMRALAGVLQAAFNPDRLNYGILGNAEPHLHWHIIPRYETDPRWGHSPWPNPHPVPISEDEQRATVARIKPHLPANLR